MKRILILGFLILALAACQPQQREQVDGVDKSIATLGTVAEIDGVQYRIYTISTPNNIPTLYMSVPASSLAWQNGKTHQYAASVPAPAVDKAAVQAKLDALQVQMDALKPLLAQ